MNTLIRPAISLFALLTVVTGIAYPLLITGVAKTAFADQAAGSLIIDNNGQLIGSRLIGQNFSSPQYLWGRPSATGPQPYNAVASSGSNQGPLNPALTEALNSRAAALHAADPTNTLPIPIDLLTASASGLDPHISPAAASYQAARIARERKLTPEQVEAIIAQHTEQRQWGFFGEERVNVLAVNLALDQAQVRPTKTIAMNTGE